MDFLLMFTLEDDDRMLTRLTHTRMLKYKSYDCLGKHLQATGVRKHGKGCGSTNFDRTLDIDDEVETQVCQGTLLEGYRSSLSPGAFFVYLHSVTMLCKLRVVAFDLAPEICTLLRGQRQHMIACLLCSRHRIHGLIR
jgi:hypothetical protein